MRAEAGVIYGVVIEVHAHILFEVAAAFADQAAGTTAGARADGDGRCLLDKGAHLVIGCGLGVVFNGAHDGHNTHEHHALLAVLHNGSNHCDAAAGVLLKACAEVGVALALLVVREDALHDAGHPDGVVPTGLCAVETLHGAAHAGLVELVKLLTGPFDACLAALCKLLGGAGCVKLHVEHDLAHIVVHDRLENAVLGVIVGDAGVGQAFEADLCRQLQNIRSVCHN